MFYEANPDKQLRFGDVIFGPITAFPSITAKFLDNLNKDFHIDIAIPRYSVILTPCCSIDDDKISLTPLLQIRGTFFKNEYFREDLTRINREMEPQQAVPDNIWQQLPRAEQARRLEKGRDYAFSELFVYEAHKLLPDYELNDKERGKIQTNCYMIDFRDAHRLNTEKLKSPDNVFLKSKCLQLSIATRKELQNKIANFFDRVPEEDMIESEI